MNCRLMEPLLIAPCYSLHFYQIFFEKITDCYHIFLYLCKYNMYNTEKLNKTKPI